MRIAVEPNYKLLRTASPHAATNWDLLLKCQVDLFLAQEVQLLLGLSPWRRAHHVLDAGCGNGYYLSRLKGLFPNKTYCGIDVSPELIGYAANRYPEITFALNDITTHVSGHRYDAIIMRFLVQHLRDFEWLLRVAERLLSDIGRLIVIETDLEASCIYPQSPAFLGMLATYARVSSEHGAIKTLLLADPQRFVAEANQQLVVETSELIACPQVGPFISSKLLTTFQLWTDLCDQSDMFAFDFAAVRDELRTWAARSATFSSVGLRVIVLSRR